MLKFARTPTGSLSAATTSLTASATVSALRPVINRKTSFVTSECGYSKATVVIKNLSLPLAWPSDEYFSIKKGRRVFTVQLLIKTSDGKEFFSKPVENIDKSQIDVIFDDIFYIEDQSPDFKLELIVCCRRTDEKANIVQTLSRSMGANVTNSLKRYVQSWNSTSLAKMQQLDANYIENYRNPDKMCLLGSATFKLQNASLSGRKHNYTIRLFPHVAHGSIAKPQLLPLFGQISLILLVQPLSLALPLAQGTLDVFYIEGGILLQKLFCILQGAFLKCFNCSPQRITQYTKPDMMLPINECTQIETTAFQTALRLKLINPETKELRHFICVTSTQNSFLGWKNALKLQIRDTDVWGGFSVITSNPHGVSVPPKPPKLSTVGRSVRFESAELSHKNGDASASTVSSPRYGFELQSVRRLRQPITNVFESLQKPQKPGLLDLNKSITSSSMSLTKLTASSIVEKQRMKPIPKPRLSGATSNPYVISLKIGSDDGLPEPTCHTRGSSSSSSNGLNPRTSDLASVSAPVRQSNFNSSSSFKVDQTNRLGEFPSTFVYGVDQGTNLASNRQLVGIHRSSTLYNNCTRNEITRL